MAPAKCLLYQSVNVSPWIGLSIPRIRISLSLGKALPNNGCWAKGSKSGACLRVRSVSTNFMLIAYWGSANQCILWDHRTPNDVQITTET